jgi:hypothetical protein
METLTVEKTNAIKAFEQADESGKQMLKTLFPNLVPGKITDRIKTFEDALALYSASENTRMFLNYNSVDGDLLAAQAHLKMTIIAQALNEGWTPNWNDEDEYKYYPWFYLDSPGFQLFNVYSYYTSSNVGSRLCFKSEELAQYAANQFKNIYEQLFTL